MACSGLRISSMNIWRSRALVTLLLLSTIKLPCRETGGRPTWRRPWPFDCGKPFSGWRDISKFAQYAVIHQRHALRRARPRHQTGNSPAARSSPASPPVGSSTMRDEVRQERLANFAREGLALADILLAESFVAMPENFMEENRGGAAGQHRRPRKGLGQRRLDQRFQFLLKHGALRQHRLVIWSRGRIDPIEIVVAVDVHSVGRLALDEELQPVAHLAELKLCALARHADIGSALAR